MSEQQGDHFDQGLNSWAKAWDALGDMANQFGRGIIAKANEGLTSAAEAADKALIQPASQLIEWGVNVKNKVVNAADRGSNAIANKAGQIKKDATGIYNQAIDNTSDNMLATADKASQLKKGVTGVWSGLAAVASRGVWKLNKVTKENIIKPIVAAVDTKYTSLEKWATDKLNQVKTKVTKVGNDIGKGVEKVGNTITDAHKSAVEGTVKVIVAWADAKNKVVKIYNEWYDEWKDPEKFAQEQKQAKAREVAAKTPAPKKPAQSSSKT